MDGLQPCFLSGIGGLGTFCGSRAACSVEQGRELEDVQADLKTREGMRLSALQWSRKTVRRGESASSALEAMVRPLRAAANGPTGFESPMQLGELGH